MFKQLLGSRNTIYIHTEKQQYYSGEQVNGTISFSVVEPTHVDAVFLKIKGYQHAEFEYMETISERDPHDPKKTEYRTIVRRARERRPFLRQRYCVHSYKCTLSNGNFQFPFQFTLPTGLPGTFYLSGQASNFSARVLYKVKAEVAVPGMFKANVKHSQDILINQPLLKPLMGTETYKEAKVTFLCCFPKGDVSLSANVDRNAYGPGDMVQLRLIVDNSQSKVNLEELTFKLVRKLTLTAQGRSFADVRTLVKSKSPQVRIGERAERFIQLHLPHDTEPSTRAPLVDCEYELSVELHVPWSPNVVVRQPVQVFAPVRPTYVSVPVMPAGWSPTVFPTVLIDTDSYASY